LVHPARKGEQANVTASDSFLAHWQFHLPNMLLAALFYTLIGRVILAMLFRLSPERVLMRAFARVTDPVLHAVAAITPRVVPPGLVLVFALVWLMLLRMLLFITAVAFGMRPGVMVGP
jgi:YggT family protein